MSLNIKDVEHVAKLARLGITDKEKKKFTTQLGAILGYIEKLGELDTEGVSPTAHVMVKGNVFREDVAKQSEVTDKILDNAPDREDRFFKVKKIIE